MKKISIFTVSLAATFFIVAANGSVSIAAPSQPKITVTKDPSNGYETKRIIARYGIVNDAKRQGKLAVKELSFLLKKYPNATSWAVAFNVDKLHYRIIDYRIQKRQLIMHRYDSDGNLTGWLYDFYPAHIHKAAQQSLNLNGLWNIVNKEGQRKQHWID